MGEISGMNGRQTNKIPTYQRWFGIILIVAMLGSFFLAEERKEGNVFEMKALAGGRRSKIPKAACPSFCNARHEQLKRHFGGDLLDTNYMVEAVKRERENLHNKLKVDYGEQAFKDMWVDKDGKVKGLHLATSADKEKDPSTPKFRRKLQMKVLEVQMKILDEQKNLEGCVCSAATGDQRRLSGEEQQTLVLPEVNPYYTRFVFSNGGHSASAAHGNLYNESYTSFMEQHTKASFSAIGIDFEGRNYGMGGMDSAPQLAMCNEQVYGAGKCRNMYAGSVALQNLDAEQFSSSFINVADADIISWDFGMTDGKQHWKSHLYASRTGVHQNRPTHISINIGGRDYNRRLDNVRNAENYGVPTLHLIPDNGIVQGCPDSFGLGEAELNKIGPFARMFKCKDQIEKDECRDDKYTEAKFCPKRKGMASWHPGWKQHALTGNILSLFLIDSMVVALESLANDHGGESPHDTYARLKREEDAEYEAFFKTHIPDKLDGLINETLVGLGVKANPFFRNRAMCRTALLPAKSRYLGIMSSDLSSAVGDYDGEYYRGVNSAEALAHPPAKDSANLTLIKGKGHPACEFLLAIDRKDYFYADEHYGWASHVIPNDAELATYAPEGFNPDGLIILCKHKCDWNKCPEEEVSFDSLREGKWHMDVNGDSVIDLLPIDQCHLVRTEKGGFYNKPNSDGKYVLRVNVPSQGGRLPGYIRLTTMIIV